MYRLVTLGHDVGWATNVEDEVVRAFKRVVQDPGAVTCERSVPDSTDDPVVVAYLADNDAATDSEILAGLEKARTEAYSVLPVSRDGERIGAQLPTAISRLNTMTWLGQEQEVALRVLEHFGVAEAARMLFLSYRRLEAGGLALQLRRALCDRAFDVFLDRFSVPPGEDFQRRLDIELADKAFVLLLESPAAIGSDWVQHEVAFALSHRICVLALTMPDTDPADQFEPIDDAFRLRLSADDFDGGAEGQTATLADAALARVLSEIEVRCARQLRRRRAQLLGSVNDLLFESGYDREPLADWALVARKDGEPARVCLVTPRAPTPHDFRLVDGLRQALDEETVGQVIHETPVLDSDRQSLIDWIVEDRPLYPIKLRDLA